MVLVVMFSSVMPFRDLVPRAFLAFYGVLFVWLAVDPFDRSVWWAENIPIISIVVLLGIFYIRGIRFSPLAYALMSVLVYLHTIGGHYTFERVPFDWFNHLFGFERNMYDRVAHFSVGFYAFAFAEWLDYHRVSSRRFVTYLLPLCAVAFVALGYEIIEWWYAASSDSSAGSAFLGSQGDIWDAQKDMLADTLGAVFALILYRVWGDRH